MLRPRRDCLDTRSLRLTRPRRQQYRAVARCTRLRAAMCVRGSLSYFLGGFVCRTARAAEKGQSGRGEGRKGLRFEGFGGRTWSWWDFLGTPSCDSSLADPVQISSHTCIAVAVILDLEQASRWFCGFNIFDYAAVSHMASQHAFLHLEAIGALEMVIIDSYWRFSIGVWRGIVFAQYWCRTM